MLLVVQSHSQPASPLPDLEGPTIITLEEFATALANEQQYAILTRSFVYNITALLQPNLPLLLQQLPFNHIPLKDSLSLAPEPKVSRILQHLKFSSFCASHFLTFIIPSFRICRSRTLNHFYHFLHFFSDTLFPSLKHLNSQSLSEAHIPSHSNTTLYQIQPLHLIRSV